MLSAIILCEDKPPAGRPGGVDAAEILARTLASLVTAKVHGLLADVRIAGPFEMNLGILANHAGCAFVEAEKEADRLHLGLTAARGSDILLLRSGQALEPAFMEEAGDFLTRRQRDKSSAALLRAAPETFLERIFPTFAPASGLIATRDLMLRAPRSGFQGLASFVAPATTFRVRTRPIV